jgi:ribonuclease P protein component
MVGLFAFPKEERIRRRADFLKILREGTKFRTAHFWISFRPNGLSHRRLGITVGKKTGSAVVRNRLKRRVREFYRQNKGLFPGGTDFVITAKEDAGRLDFRQMANELKGVLRER